MVIRLNQTEYKRLVKKYSPKEPRIRNVIVAFLSGGLIGFVGEIIIHLFEFCFGASITDAGIWLCLLIIFIASLLTGLGFFDNVVGFCKCGLIIPTTGFAHSMTSSAVDYKQDGMITGLGSNVFKLAGSVILFGIISAFILVIVRVIFGG